MAHGLFFAPQRWFKKCSMAIKNCENSVKIPIKSQLYLFGTALALLRRSREALVFGAIFFGNSMDKQIWYLRLQDPRRASMGHKRLLSSIAFAFEHLEEPITLRELAQSSRMSRFCYAREFYKAFGMSPMRWLWLMRLEHARQLMMEYPAWPFTAVAVASGFQSSAHFSRLFREVYRQCPRYAVSHEDGSDDSGFFSLRENILI